MFGRFERVRNVRLVAILIIGIAIALYVAPYLFGVVRCVDQPEPNATVKQCLAQIYDDARSDTNLAAGIIALAIILAAWRPAQDGPE